MAKTRDYMDYLDSKIEIAPANSQEEYQAAETIAEILRDHDLETTIEEFDSHPFGQIVGPILAIILFICLVAAGLTEGTVHIVLMVVAALCVGLPLYLHFSGTRLFQDLGPGSTSQNVVAVHRATGDKVIKGARPIVIVAHYDTPRQSLLRKGPLAQYQAAIRMATIPCAIATAVALLFQFMMFLPGVVITFMWIVGLIAAFPLLLLAIIDIIDHFGSCTTGANDNKSSVAALLSIANKVRPIKDRVDDDFNGREGKPLRRRIHDVPEPPAQPRRIEVLEEVKGVRHGAQVLASLGILPEDCEIIYQEPRLQVIEEEVSTGDDTSISKDRMSAEVDVDEAELAAPYDDEEYEEYDDTSEDDVVDDIDEEYSDEEPEEESYDEDEWFDEYEDEDDYEDEDEYAEEDVEEQQSIDEDTDEEDYEADDLEESDEEYDDEELEDDSEDEDEDDYGNEDEDLDYEDDEEYDDEEWESESSGGRLADIWEAIKAWFVERIAAIREFFSKDRGSDIDIARGEDRRTKSTDSDELDEWMDEYEDDTNEDETFEDEEDEEEDTDLSESEENDYEDEVEAHEDDEFNNPYDYADEEILDDDQELDDRENDLDDSDSDLVDDVPFYGEYEQFDEEYVDEDETEDFEDSLDGEFQEEYEEDYEDDIEDDFGYDDDESYVEYEYEDEDEYVEEIEEVEEAEEDYTEDEVEYEDTYDEYDEDTYEDEFEEDEFEVEDASSGNQNNAMSVGERLERFFSMIRSTPAPEGEDEYDDDDEPNHDGEAHSQGNPYDYSKEGDEYEYEAYAGAYEDREKNEVREVITSGRKSMYTTEYSSDLDEDAYGYEDETYQPGDYEEEAYYDEEYVEAELEFDDKSGVRVPDILPDPNKLHFDREEDADILPRDTTGLDTLSDSYDLYTGEVNRVSKRQKPEPLADPNWGVSSYQPARPVMNIARRAALFDLPDPSAEAIDPLYNDQDEYEEEIYDEYESYEAYEDDEPYDELTEMEEIVRAETEESAASYDEPTSGYEVMHEEEASSSADEDRAGTGNSRNATGFWSDNRSSSWKGGATMRSDLRDDLDNVPLILDADDLQDAILELGDDFLVAHDIWFVATGASEVGHAGIRAFIDEHRRDIRGSFLINLDSIGAGTLSMLVREGMSAPRRADRRLVRMIGDIANDLHVKLDTAMYNFDERESATTMRSRIRSVTIAGLDDNNLPALSHTANDVPENVDPKQVSDVVRIITELIRRS